MKYAMFGGTFNPIHMGHVSLAEEVRLQFDCEKIIFVPSCIPPHKPSNTINPLDRCKMIELAIAGNPFFCVDSCELDRGGLSYTVDTINYLCKKYTISAHEKMGLIIGDDLTEEFFRWKEAAFLAENCTIILVQRQKVEQISEPYFVSNHTEYACSRLANTLLPISSSDIRNRIQHNGNWRYLVHPAVYEYILKNKLYGE